MNPKENITVVFTNRAYNAIISESFSKSPLETGGILLGHILSTDVWVVEVIPPGPRSVFQRAYFEYDCEFVNYLAIPIAAQYEKGLQVLGLWHRHPGSLDTFSSGDAETNTKFAKQNPYGVISGLVNIDPLFRLTMYHVANASPTTSPVPTCYTNNFNPLGYIKPLIDAITPKIVKQQYLKIQYTKIEVVVDKNNDIIPSDLLSLKYYPKQGEHPQPPAKTKTIISQNKTTYGPTTINNNRIKSNTAQLPQKLPNQIMTTVNHVTPPNESTNKPVTTNNTSVDSNILQQPNHSPNQNNANTKYPNY